MKFARIGVVALTGAATVLCIKVARAQDDDFQTWNMVTLNKSFDKDWRGYLEVQPRLGDDSSRPNALLLRGAVGYNIQRNISVWLGYANVTFYVPRTIHEERPFQQLLMTSRLPRYDIINRTRFEQRFLPGTEDPSLRARHFVRGFFPIDRSRKWAVVAQEELFWNLNSATANLQSGYDQNRAFLGVSVAATKNLRIETGYQYVHIRVPTAAPDRELHTLLTMFNFVY